MSDYLIDLDTGCWVWQRAKTTAGYGTLTLDGKTRYAHRVFYEGYVADIPEGLVLDHLCRSPGCCNPEHLEPVTFAENTRRTRRVSCKRGHPLIGDNVYVAPDGERQCRECSRIRDRARLRRRMERREAERGASSQPGGIVGDLIAPLVLPVPYGKCQCGCGQDTKIATKTITTKGVVKGEPLRHLRGHGSSWREDGGYATPLENSRRTKRERHEN